MKNPTTVYILFEQYINDALICIHREFELGNHNPKVIILLNTIKNHLDKAKKHLIANPTIQANNLAKSINDLILEDKSIDVIHVSIVLNENPDYGKTSYLKYNIFSR
jgi:hypothetical protein